MVAMALKCLYAMDLKHPFFVAGKVERKLSRLSQPF